MRTFAAALAAALLVSCAPFETEEETADRYYRNALLRLGANGDPAKVRALLDEAIDLDPERPEFYTTRAIVDRILRRPQDVEADYTLAIALLRRVPEARLELATVHLNRGEVRADDDRTEGAEADFAEALRLVPGYVEAYLHRAKSRRRAGDAKGSQEDLAKARQIGAERADVFYNSGVRELRNQQTDEAERYFAFAADLDPGHVRAWMALARCAMEHGRYAAATEALTKAVELQPQAAEPWYHRANAYRAQEKWEEAFSDAIRALDRDPRNPLHYQLRGVIYRQYFKDTENAERDFTQALELDPLSSTAYLERGILYHDMRLLNEAERDVRDSLKQRASPEAILELGRILRDRGEYDKSAEAFRKGLEIFSEPVVQALLKEELGRTLQAKETDK
jgi:tetratricopeptide (TPR) repeat protein